MSTTELASGDAGRELTVHILTGLPGSGKSTLARRLVAEAKGELRRVNLDDIRRMLDGPDPHQRWTRERERSALAIQDAAIDALLTNGHDVIVDNTHLTRHQPARIAGVVGGRARFAVHDLTDVPLEECLARDARRVHPVGEDRIRALAAQHAKATARGWRLTAEWLQGPHREPALPVVDLVRYVPRAGTPRAVLCDIDGTLALKGDRGPFDFERCGEDTLNTAVADTLKLHSRNGDRIILLSGRESTYHPHTTAWLNSNGVVWDELHMRPAGDNRRDDIVKQELFDRYVRDRYDVRMSLDDRDRVVALWRRLGLPTWQVNYGNF